MSFDTYEKSREHGQPVNLYLFRYGVGPLSVVGYTSAEKPITYDNVVYEPMPVEIQNIVASGTIDNKTLPVRIPSTTRIANFYRGHPPSFPITLRMMRGHADKQNFLVFWTGRVLNGRHEGAGSHWCELTCEPISTSLRRVGLRRHYQFMCPHVLYGNQCKANRPAATFVATPVWVSGNRIGLNAGWAPDALLPKFSNGFIEYTTAEGNVEIRTLIEIETPGEAGADQTLHLTGDTEGLTAQQIRVTLGCSHLRDDCSNLHNNIANFGGFPWIPISNPVGTTNNVFY